MPQSPLLNTPEAVSTAANATPERTLPVDPVLLQSGKVVAGERSIFVTYEGNTYIFANTGTRDQFNRDPARFAAQQGGACGRMGPLGGLGDARRYALQEGMLYFFASDECMKLFRAQPRRYMEPADELPAGTPEQQAAGLAALDRWIAWAGGKDAVKAAKVFTQVSTRRVLQGADSWDVTETLEFAGPHTMRRMDTWQKVGGTAKDNYQYETLVTPDTAVITSSNGRTTPLVDARRTAFERLMNRQPYAIMRARFRPEAGLLALKTGEGTLGDARCDYIVTWFEGNATYLAIDKETGRLVQIGHPGRVDDASNASLTMDAVAYAGPEALRLPTQWVTSRNAEKDGIKGPVASIKIAPAAAP
jgi:YHS domain-containing protein